MYEVTWIESGVTRVMSEEECEELFGVAEFVEYRMGYLPHVLVIE
ncbi:unnamed protein product, partial [marine sediment metagenome]